MRKGGAARKSEAAEVKVLCPRIVAESRAVGLRIGDSDNL